MCMLDTLSIADEAARTRVIYEIVHLLPKDSLADLALIYSPRELLLARARERGYINEHL